VHQEPSVTCKHRAILRTSDPDQLGVINNRRVGNIDSQEPEISHELPQMPICHEAPNAATLQSHGEISLRPQAYRMYVKHSVSRELMCELDGNAVTQDQINLWMRNTAGLNRIFDCRLLPQDSPDFPTAFMPLEKDSKITMERQDDWEAVLRLAGAHAAASATCSAPSLLRRVNHQ
jgi:hypothetical protein